MNPLDLHGARAGSEMVDVEAVTWAEASPDAGKLTDPDFPPSPRSLGDLERARDGAAGEIQCYTGPVGPAPAARSATQ